MKRLAFLTIALAALVACGPKHMFSGNISGIESGQLMFVSDDATGEMVMDTVILDNGKFSYDPPTKDKGILMIVDTDHFIDYITLSRTLGAEAIKFNVDTDVFDSLFEKVYDEGGRVIYRVPEG